MNCMSDCLAALRASPAHLPRLAELGVTAIELMPIAEFPGARNWGYDGVLPSRPECSYGSPDDLRALVDAAHDHGLMIFLDVVYNHFGPDGNYLHSMRHEMFRDRRVDAVGAGNRFSSQGGPPLLHRKCAVLAPGVSLRWTAL